MAIFANPDAQFRADIAKPVKPDQSEESSVVTVTDCENDLRTLIDR